jgi:phytoene dehydrogenase-like protein
VSDYDAIVVGAGHNGRTAAALLQRGLLQTLCLEANIYAGGMAATVELIDGFRYEIAGSVQFPIPSEITKDLGLDTLPTVDADVMSVVGARHGHGAARHACCQRIRVRIPGGSPAR